MRSSSRTLAALAASVLLVAATATTAQAHVNSGTVFSQATEINHVGTPECLSGDFSGTETVTFTTSGRFVETRSGFHVEGTNAVAGRQVFTNGDIDVVDASSHFAFNTTATSGQTVFTTAGHELHTTYNAKGDVIARTNYAGVTHTTYRDVNANGRPDDGEFTSNFERVHATCL
jgi:YD repeat-containing protein